ncbi:hypothetical protein Tco_0785395 [Tanacetum coccineum]
MENANPPPPNNRPILPATLHTRINQELHELKVILAFVDARLESIEQFLNNFADQPNDTNMNNLETNDESGETPLVSPFPHLDNDSDDEEVPNELKSTAYFDPFLPMNIITRKAYNTIMVEGLESTRKNLVAIIRNVYVFVGSFTYTTDFVVLENIGEFIQINEVEVVVEHGDGVTINTRRRHHDTCEGVTPTPMASNAQVIFDEKKLGSS